MTALDLVDAPRIVRHLGAVLDGFGPCYGKAAFGKPPACGCTRRIVIGFGHPVRDMYTVECCACGAQAAARFDDVGALAGGAK